MVNIICFVLAVLMIFHLYGSLGGRIMLNLVLFILAVCFLVCTISGVIGFFTDLRNFKAEHEFSGNRKQLIEYLMFGEDVEIKAVPAVETNDSEVSDDESTHSV